MKYPPVDILRKVYTEKELIKLNLVKKITDEKNYQEYYLFDKLTEHLAEGSPEGGIIRHVGWDLTDDELKRLLECRKNSSATFIICLIKTCTDTGTILKPEFVQYVKALPCYNNQGVQEYLDKNQQLETYEKEAKEFLEQESPRSAYYLIRNHPKFNQYKDEIIKLCIKNGRQYEQDITTTRSQTAYETIPLICAQKEIVIPQLAEAAKKLEEIKSKWAPVAYFLIGKIKEAKRLIER